MLSENLKYLRKKRHVSQQQVADDLGIPRSTLGDYERDHTEPNIQMLVQLCRYFEVSIDDLLTRKLSHDDLTIIQSNDLKVLAISVDQDNRQNIEFVSAKAEAGYLESFQDPEYIQELPKLYFPNIPDGTYRAFEIQGDSMLPMAPGSVVVCSYVERLEELKNERTYVIATHMDGIVYKRILLNPDGISLTAISDNPTFPPYRISYRNIAEVWSYYAHISFTDTKAAVENVLEERILDIQEKVTYIKERMA